MYIRITENILFDTINVDVHCTTLWSVLYKRSVELQYLKHVKSLAKNAHGIKYNWLKKNYQLNTYYKLQHLCL